MKHSNRIIVLLSILANCQQKWLHLFNIFFPYEYSSGTSFKCHKSSREAFVCVKINTKCQQYICQIQTKLQNFPWFYMPRPPTLPPTPATWMGPQVTCDVNVYVLGQTLSFYIFKLSQNMDFKLWLNNHLFLLLFKYALAQQFGLGRYLLFKENI